MVRTEAELQQQLSAVADNLKKFVRDITVVSGTDVFLRLASNVARRHESQPIKGVKKSRPVVVNMPNVARQQHSNAAACFLHQTSVC